MSRVVVVCPHCSARTTLGDAPGLRRGDVAPPWLVEVLKHPPLCAGCQQSTMFGMVGIADPLPDWFFGGVRIDGEHLRRQLTKGRT